MKRQTIILLLTYCLNSLGGEIEEYFFKDAKTNPSSSKEKLVILQASRSSEQINSTNHGITEIGIERTGCFGSCPAYVFVVKSDGSFHYKGGKYASRSGEYVGAISFSAFRRLAWFIRDSDYAGLQRAYEANATDLPSTYVMVVVDGKKKVVRNYGNAGPSKLWAIQELIDDLMIDAEWIPTDQQDSSKK